MKKVIRVVGKNDETELKKCEKDKDENHSGRHPLPPPIPWPAALHTQHP